MKNSIFNTLLVLAVSASFFSACKKGGDDPTADAKTNIVGAWVSTKITSNGADITATTGGTFDFKNDGTFAATATESGFTIPLDGTYEFRANGDSLALDYGFNAVYFVHHLTEKDMKLGIKSGGETRVADFVKQ